jgi:hypothetical protein
MFGRRWRVHGFAPFYWRSGRIRNVHYSSGLPDWAEGGDKMLIA